MGAEERAGRGRRRCGAGHTFANLDLDVGIALGHIFDAPHYLRHGGRLVR